MELVPKAEFSIVTRASAAQAMNGRAAWFSRILPIHQQQITEDGPSSDLFVH